MPTTISIYLSWARSSSPEDSVAVSWQLLQQVAACSSAVQLALHRDGSRLRSGRELIERLTIIADSILLCASLPTDTL